MVRSRVAGALALCCLAGTLCAGTWTYDGARKILANDMWSLNASAQIVDAQTNLTITGVSAASPVYNTSSAALNFAEAVEDTGCAIAAINANFAGAAAKIATLTFPPTLLTIGANAFRGAKPTNDIVIPPSVTYIGANAFTLCGGGHLTLGGGAPLVIAQWAFSEASFSGITMLDGVISIGDSAFRACKKMSGDLTVPETVTSIGMYAFYQNTLDGSLTIGGGTSLTIGQDAFADCKFTGTLTFREGGATGIGYESFKNCQFTGDLALPNGIVSVGQFAFYNCKSMKGNLIIGNSVKSIGQQAFWDCAFEGFLSVGEGVTSIAYGAFGYSRFKTAYLGCGPENLGANLFDVNYVQTVLVAPGKGWEDAVQYVGWPNSYRNGAGYASAEDALNAADARYNNSFGAYIAVGYGEPPISYAVNFDANGGNGSMAAQQRVFGSAAPLPANTFFRMAMRFTGWATSPDGDVEYLDEDVCPTLVSAGTFNVTLYAKWQGSLGGGNPGMPALAKTNETPVIAYIAVDADGVDLSWDVGDFFGKEIYGHVIHHSPDLTRPAAVWDSVEVEEKEPEPVAMGIMSNPAKRSHKMSFKTLEDSGEMGVMSTTGNGGSTSHFFTVIVKHGL